MKSLSTSIILIFLISLLLLQQFTIVDTTIMTTILATQIVSQKHKLLLIRQKSDNHNNRLDSHCRHRQYQGILINNENRQSSSHYRRPRSVIMTTSRHDNRPISIAISAFVSNFNSIKKFNHPSKLSSKIIIKPTLLNNNIKTPTTTTTTTTLQLKFKTFEEMIHHHHNTPLLIDFYAPWCGPCKLMKGEIRSIRDQLELLGPMKTAAEMMLETEGGDREQQQVEEEDCVVEDVIAMSSVCLDDGYIEEQQGDVSGGADGGEGSASSSVSSVRVKEDAQLLLKDLPTSIAATAAATTAATSSTEQDTSATKQKQQSTTNNTNLKSTTGIPVYHVNTNKFPQVGAKNHIAGLPTLVLFFGGQELWRNEGLIKGEEILRVLSEFQMVGWKRPKMEMEMDGGVEDGGVQGIGDERREDKVAVVVAVGEGADKKKKRKGRRLGG